MALLDNTFLKLLFFKYTFINTPKKVDLTAFLSK